MSKYYFLAMLVFAAVLYYIFIQDPCNILVKADFSKKNPDYEIVDIGASEGSVDSVRCHVYYLKPDDREIYKDIWLYEKSGNDWSLSTAIATEMVEPEADEASVK